MIQALSRRWPPSPKHSMCVYCLYHYYFIKQPTIHKSNNVIDDVILFLFAVVVLYFCVSSECECFNLHVFCYLLFLYTHFLFQWIIPHACWSCDQIVDQWLHRAGWISQTGILNSFRSLLFENSYQLQSSTINSKCVVSTTTLWPPTTSTSHLRTPVLIIWLLQLFAKIFLVWK